MASRCQVNCLLAVFDRLSEIFEPPFSFIPSAEMVAEVIKVSSSIRVAGRC